MRLAFVLSILMLGFSTLDCRADKRIALVVGNSNYQSVASLNNPRNDAMLIADTLRKAGFTLIGNRAQLDLDRQHGRFSELRTQGARRQNRLLRQIDRSRRGPQGQGKVRQELACSILSASDRNDPSFLQ